VNMATISLSTQTIRISKYGVKNVKANGFLPDQEFLQVLEEYFSDLKNNMYLDNDKGFLLQVEKLERSRRSISGFLKVGEYGIESELINKDSKVLSYERLWSDAEMLPYYFLIHVPKDANEVIAIFQKTGASSVKDKFDYHFGAYFTRRFPNYHIHINKLIPSHLTNQLLDNGRVMKIRFVKFGIPRDITDAVNLGHEENEGIAEIQITAKRGGEFNIIDRIKNTMEGKRDIKSFVELKSFEYNDVKIQVNVNGKYRTISLLNQDNIRAEYDISKDVETDPGGNPVYESINDIARGLMREIVDGIGLESKDV
jgi:hypothetical protein